MSTSTSSITLLPSSSAPREKGEHWANAKGTKFKNPWESFKPPVSRLGHTMTVNADAEVPASRSGE
jgi:hypothetical protein